MGYQVVRQPLWIEGKDIQQGVKVLSGPFDLSQISSDVIPETARAHSDPCYNARLIDLPEATDSSLLRGSCRHAHYVLYNFSSGI